MEAPADTMGVEGGGEGGTEVDIGDWLTKHRLSKFKQKFIDDEIAMDDLLSWDEQYLSEMCKEYGMRPPFDKRLKSAVLPDVSWIDFPRFVVNLLCDCLLSSSLTCELIKTSELLYFNLEHFAYTTHVTRKCIVQNIIVQT
eukprot:67309_1